VSASRKLIDQARVEGLSPALAEPLERELAPRIDSVLASVPELPPATADETQMLTGLVEAYRPYLPLLLRALDKLIDAASASLDDLFDPAIQGDPSKRRSLHHLEEALASLIRVGTATAALLAHHPELGQRALPWTADVAELPDELRPYLRGLLATLVGLDRIDGDIKQLAPWAWMARRETLKSEGLVMVALHELESVPPRRPRRVPGGWKGRVRVADDFDAPLPKDIEDSFYDDTGL
jgi:hypothetical protein